MARRAERERAFGASSASFGAGIPRDLSCRRRGRDGCGAHGDGAHVQDEQWRGWVGQVFGQDDTRRSEP